jgi:hypothetical protein
VSCTNPPANSLLVTLFVRIAPQCPPNFNSPPTSTQPQGMSSSVDVHPRSAGIWSYFGFNTSTAGTRNRRSSSASLPTRNAIEDPYEKPDRHTSNSSDSGSYLQEPEYKSGAIAWMNHGQRARYLKWGGLITLILFIFVYLAPGERSVGSFVGGKLGWIESESLGNG